MRMPAVAARSLIAIGTPRNGPSPEPESMRAGSRERLLGADRDEGVEQRVEPLDPLERQRATSSDGGDLAGPHEPRLLDGREERELHRGEPTSALNAASSAPEVGVPGQHEIDMLSRSLALDVGILGGHPAFPFR